MATTNQTDTPSTNDYELAFLTAWGEHWPVIRGSIPAENVSMIKSFARLMFAEGSAHQTRVTGRIIDRVRNGKA